MSTVASIRLSDLLALAWSALRRNRLRSFLTMGAIAVGISVMMYLISFGLGLERLTLDSVSQSAALLSLNVTSGSEKLQPLTSKAIDKIRGTDKVKDVLPQLTIKGQMSLDKTLGSATVQGVEPGFLEIGDSTKLVVGSYYRTDDEQTMVVTTGFLKLFGLESGKNPLVVFTLIPDKEKYPSVTPVDSINVSGVVDDNAVIVYLPRLYLEKVLGGAFDSYTSAKVRVNSLDDIKPVKDVLIANGFRVSTVIDTVDEIKSVFKWIRLVLFSLGMIAIFVASIGMFNTLTISLLERTKEIAIMKALGVKRADIRKLFLVESFLMGFMGGGAGILLAFVFQQATLFALSLLASLVQGAVPKIFLNEWYVVAGFLLFSLTIAGLTGVYPARRAARINPIEAIRYE